MRTNDQVGRACAQNVQKIYTQEMYPFSMSYGHYDVVNDRVQLHSPMLTFKWIATISQIHSKMLKCLPMGNNLSEKKIRFQKNVRNKRPLTLAGGYDM